MGWKARRLWAVLGVVLLVSAGCGDDDGDNNNNGNQAGVDGGLGDGGSKDGGTQDASPLPEGAFRYGMNFGHRNSAWGDPLYAELAQRVGASSARVSLPERHLDQWGYDIELGDMAEYASLGFGNLVAFLSAPIRSHSTAPSSAADWELAYYIPANLHEPIWTAPGEVNPDNYWAHYVYETVSRYHPWVRIWEVWNEPDWVSDWSVTQTWDTDPPTADELPRFNGSIYDYVRLLRVTWEVVKQVDPSGHVAVGGLGYENFLDAILRYTDNPTDGSVDADHPETGGAYFDFLSFHHYPLYTAGNSEAAVDGFLSHRDRFQAVLDAAGKTVEGWVATETGAPHVARSGEPSGSEYARNYLLKVMTLAQVAGVDGVDWFLLTDTATAGQESSAYEVMGLYEDVIDLSTIDEATRTEPGIAYATLGSRLRGAVCDPVASEALGLPAEARGAVFRWPDSGRRAWMLWAVPEGEDEQASSTAIIEVEGPARLHRWDASRSGTSELLEPAAGLITVSLDGTPALLIEGD